MSWRERGAFALVWRQVGAQQKRFVFFPADLASAPEKKALSDNMQTAIVIGRVMCSRKYETLEGLKLLLIQPLTWEERKVKGDPIVAVDTVGAGANEFVFWVAAREAAIACGGTSLADTPPVDAAVVGIVDGVNLQDWTKELKPKL